MSNPANQNVVRKSDGVRAPLSVTDDLQLINAGYDSSNDAQVIESINPQWTRYVGVSSLISSAQTLTGSFADLGNEINASGYKYVTLYLTIDINSSNDVRIKVLGKHTVAGSEEFVFDPDLLNAADTTASTSYIEFDTDADQLATVRIPVDNALPVLQIQASVGTVGATGADIDAAYYTLGY